MNQLTLRITCAIACLTLLAGCGRNMNSNTYTEGSAAGKVLEGTVISTRPVTIKGHDKLSQNTTGGLIGGAAGGVAGSQFGNGGGSTAAAVGGVIAGAVIGAVAEDMLSNSEGTEYIVKIKNAHNKKTAQRKKRITSRGTEQIQDDIASGIDTDTVSDIVSVVQATDPAIEKGAHVYVIYSDDRPRITLAE